MRWQLWQLRPAPLLLAVLLTAAGVRGLTTVSVYLPQYQGSDWEVLRGSIVSSDQFVTAYTVFCADQAPTCQIAGDIPFVFTEGAATLEYGGSAPGEITANLHCKLEGKTAATCTGSSSFGPGFHQGSVTGPTQTAWTSTLSGTNVVWGVLTLATPGAAGTTDIDGTAAATGSQPVSTKTSSACRQGSAVEGWGWNRWMVVVSVGAIVIW